MQMQQVQPLPETGRYPVKGHLGRNSLILFYILFVKLTAAKQVKPMYLGTHFYTLYGP